jgi:catechol 2,3-dioxygenase-like lactoylglutathione lyase family enzyme
MLHDSMTFSGYSVHNLDVAEDFYKNVLGLEISRDWMGIQLKVADGRKIFLYAKDDHRPATFTILNFTVDSIDAAVDALTSKGVVMEKYDTLGFDQDEKGIARGKETDNGPNIAWFKDPSGNILSVLEK